MAGGIGSEEQHGAGNLLRTGDFTQRNAKLKLLAKAANAQLLRVVGSSNSMIFGFMHSDRAIATRCC
jgi:hypothetical protein